MINYVQDIDFNKYHTFFLSYTTVKNDFNSHLVRPCTASYEEVIDKSKTRIFTLEGAVMAFDNSATLAEIILECAINGITLDFIDIMAENDDKDRWRSREKCIQCIDTHKDDIRKYLDKVQCPKHYIAVNRIKTDPLKHLVVDRFAQDQKIDFLKGKYDKKAVVAGFKEYVDAKEFCKKMNN